MATIVKREEVDFSISRLLNPRIMSKSLEGYEMGDMEPLVDHVKPEDQN